MNNEVKVEYIPYNPTNEILATQIPSVSSRNDEVYVWHDLLTNNDFDGVVTIWGTAK